MRKQTKVVAVASAAALLAIGASMTSFAATGWVEEDGTWYWYDKDGNRAEDTWKKSGDNWYWLSSEEGGAMAIDTIIEDDDDYYYVDANGVMVRNTWVKVVNEDQDDDDDPAEYNYYYMQSNGKAYKAGDGTTKFRTIDGKRYAFDSDGKMLYGWVDDSSSRLSGDTDWADVSEDVYYLGNWDDGAMKTGWQKINVTMPDDDEDEDHWFWFKSNGKRFELTSTDAGKNLSYSTKTINGKKYGFDANGVMVYEWTSASGSSGSASVSSWKYFSDPEDGARKTKGWFKVVAPEADDDDRAFTEYTGVFAGKDADDEEERWYYADGNGALYEGVIKRIKGKYYAFRPEVDGKDRDRRGASMLSGLVLLQMGSNGEIISVLDDGVDADELSDLLDGKYDGDFFSQVDGDDDTDVFLYYFGSSDSEDTDGAMKTGNVTVNLDGSSFNFKFSKSGGVESKGRGVNEIDSKKYIYKFGCRIKADSDDKYKVVHIANPSRITKASDITLWSNDDLAAVRDTATVTYSYKRDSGSWVRDDQIKVVAGKDAFKNCYLTNVSGTVVREKTAGKDGAEWYFYVKDGENGDGVRMYTSEKSLSNATMDNEVNAPSSDVDRLSNWRTSAFDDKYGAKLGD